MPCTCPCAGHFLSGTSVTRLPWPIFVRSHRGPSAADFCSFQRARACRDTAHEDAWIEVKRGQAQHVELQSEPSKFRLRRSAASAPNHQDATMVALLPMRRCPGRAGGNRRPGPGSWWVGGQQERLHFLIKHGHGPSIFRYSACRFFGAQGRLTWREPV